MLSLSAMHNKLNIYQRCAIHIQQQQSIAKEDSAEGTNTHPLHAKFQRQKIGWKKDWGKMLVA